jgi:hypothetical protein
MKMKTTHITLAAALCAAVSLGTGCKKNNEAGTAPAPAEKTAGSALSEGAQKATETAKEAAEQAQAQAQAAKAAAKEAATKAAADAQAQAQGIIDNAKGLLAEKKFDQVTPILSQLQGLKLTPEQQQAVADLKAELAKLLKAAPGTPGVPGNVAVPTKMGVPNKLPE